MKSHLCICGVTAWNIFRNGWKSRNAVRMKVSSARKASFFWNFKCPPIHWTFWNILWILLNSLSLKYASMASHCSGIRSITGPSDSHLDGTWRRNWCSWTSKSIWTASVSSPLALDNWKNDCPVYGKFWCTLPICWKVITKIVMNNMNVTCSNVN